MTFDSLVAEAAATQARATRRTLPFAMALDVIRATARDSYEVRVFLCPHGPRKSFDGEAYAIHWLNKDALAYFDKEMAQVLFRELVEKALRGVCLKEFFPRRPR